MGDDLTGYRGFAKQAEDAERAGRATIEALQNARQHTAESMFNLLAKEIVALEAGFNERQEAGAMLASFGQSVTIRIQVVSWQFPNLIVFEGVDQKGNPCRLLQHQNQVNLLLMTMPVEEGRKAHRIGFVAPDESK